METIVINHTCDCGHATSTRAINIGIVQWHCDQCGALIRINFAHPPAPNE